MSANIEEVYIKEKDRTLMKRVWKTYIAPHKKYLFLTIPAIIISGSCTYVFVNKIEPLINNLVGANKDTSAVMATAGLIFVAYFLQGLADYFKAILIATAGQRVTMSMRLDMYKKVFKQSQVFFNKFSSGEILTRLNSDINNVKVAMLDTGLSFVNNMIIIIALIYNMAEKSGALTLMMFLILPLLILVLRKSGGMTRVFAKKNQEISADFLKTMNETVRAPRQVQIYNAEKSEYKRLELKNKNLNKAGMRLVKVSAATAPIVQMISTLLFIAIIFYAVSLSKTNGITAGTFSSFLVSFMMVYRPIKTLSSNYNGLQSSMASMERCFEIIDYKTDIKNPKEPKKIEGDKFDIEFKNVTFKFNGAEKNTLKNLTLTIPNGKNYALVGPSGGGKTTILNMIPRFLDATAGEIKIGGVNIKDQDLNELRSYISLVSQEVILFNDTVLSNIAYSKPNATKEEIIEAAKAASAHDFIMELDNGYDTIVSEGGSNFSGGQRQRLSIARAILKDAPILLLDEATSALDTESEKNVQAALDNLASTRTTFTVAHRLSTIINADVICVVEDGEIVEKGSHPELIQKNGVYASLYNLQTKHQSEIE